MIIGQNHRKLYTHLQINLQIKSAGIFYFRVIHRLRIPGNLELKYLYTRVIFIQAAEIFWTSASSLSLTIKVLLSLTG